MVFRVLLFAALSCAGATVAFAAPRCLDVRARGKPPCPPGQDAICLERIQCLNTGFPSTTATPCLAWQCKPAGQALPEPKTTPKS